MRAENGIPEVGEKSGGSGGSGEVGGGASSAQCRHPWQVRETHPAGGRRRQVRAGGVPPPENSHR